MPPAGAFSRGSQRVISGARAEKELAASGVRAIMNASPNASSRAPRPSESRRMKQSDLLLLNCSNLPWRPIFPYAFVQVSEVARRFGLKVTRLEMLEVDPRLWEPMLRRAIEEHQPRMVGIHLRQGDTLVHSDYDHVSLRKGPPPSTAGYFPVADTKKLIEVLRTLTRAPITIGGFGFTTHARRLVDHLQVDYGVQGCPDGFFSRFEDAVAGRALESIPGLAHREPGGYVFNERGYYAPAKGTEYTDEIVGELIRFYGHAHMYGNNPTTVAIEVMRGCPFRCYFCSEPDVKGKRVNYRDLDVVEEEVRFLRSHHLKRFWFVCSELNIHGTDFAMQLAERVIRLNEERRDQPPIEWTGYALPTMSVSDLRVLQRAGYLGAMNEALSLDDENLKASGVPYRSRHTVTYLRGLLTSTEEVIKQKSAEEQAPSPSIRDSREQYAARLAKPHTGVLRLFLGNAHADEKTIYRSLERVDEEGLQEHYEEGGVVPATRVLDIQEMQAFVSDEELVSYDRAGERPADLIWPTFLYPKFLRKRLGSVSAILAFFEFVSETFLSVAHRRKKDWGWFLSNHISMAGWGRLMDRALQEDPAIAMGSAMPEEARALIDKATRGEIYDESALRPLFSPPPREKEAWNRAAQALLEHVFKTSPEGTSRVLAALGLPAREGARLPISEYKVMRLLYSRYSSLAELRADVLAQVNAPEGSVEALFLEYLLYANNVVLRPEYRELLFGPGAAAGEEALSAAESLRASPQSGL